MQVHFAVSKKLAEEAQTLAFFAKQLRRSQEICTQEKTVVSWELSADAPTYLSEVLTRNTEVLERGSDQKPASDFVQEQASNCSKK